MTFDLNKSIEILTKTPKVLQQLLRGLSKEWIENNEGENTWSPYDVVGHLIHGEKTDWIPRTRIILSNSKNKTFESFDRFAQFENSKGKSSDELLDEFETLRQANIEALQAMNIDDSKLAMKGIHPELGEVTLKELLATWVVHDLSHIKQISRVMMKNYRQEAGPWSVYIS